MALVRAGVVHFADRPRSRVHPRRRTPRRCDRRSSRAPTRFSVEPTGPSSQVIGAVTRRHSMRSSISSADPPSSRRSLPRSWSSRPRGDRQTIHGTGP